MLVSVINHLLAKEPWARARLRDHAGKVACLDAGGIVLRLRIGSDGMLETASSDAPVNVTIAVKLADLPQIAQNRERAFSYVTIAGDADFANSISQVAQNMRWEAEADLAPWIGDIAAVRVVAGAKSLVATVRETHEAMAQNLAEYFTEENPLLISPPAMAELTGGVNKMRDDVERLIKRLEKLESRLK
jgi:ubiquinone biosynthesis protein UbiJ